MSEKGTDADQRQRISFWIDLHRGEPLTFGTMLEDLAEAQVIYVGERHRIPRHHEVQARIVEELAAKGVPLVVGLEQLETFQQPVVDRFNRGEIDFDQLAEVADWGKRWNNYRQYRAILEAAQKAGAPVLALNARAEVVRKVFRGGGVDELAQEDREQLPKEMRLDDPTYTKLLRMILMVHMAVEEDTLRAMAEAQISRDETMAETVTDFLKSKQGKGRTAIVICGSGHVNYGLGIPDRVRGRMPDSKDRIIIMSESGDIELTPEEQAQAREVHISHEQLKSLGRQYADYLYVTSLKEDNASADEESE
jgi:uncharacterized iron-regulated protein